MKNDPKKRQATGQARSRRKPVKFSPARLRIVAGDLRGRKVEYNGDPATRPMKERTREAVFSLLGGYLDDKLVIDLFGGTGVLALESISRGADQAIILELSRGCVTTIIRNAQHLGIDDLVDVHNVDSLRWIKSLVKSADDGYASLPEHFHQPWVVFCCPPYRLWVEQAQQLVSLLADLIEISPPGSSLVCESDEQFDVAAALPNYEWDVREYDPATISLFRKNA